VKFFRILLSHPCEKKFVLLFDKGYFTCSLFNTDVSNSYKSLAFNELRRIIKESSWTNLKYFRSFCLEEGKKNFRIVGFPAQVRTGQLPKTNRKR
jgi:hypothetical protein